MKFKLINEFTDFSGKNILEIGDIIEPINNVDNTLDYKYLIKWEGGEMTLDINGVKEASQNGVKLFQEVKEDIISELDLIVEEVPDDDENLITNWRIQLDVKTTRKKLKEIEKTIKENVYQILES